MTSSSETLTRAPLRVDDAGAALELAHVNDLRWYGEPMMDLADMISELSDPELDPVTDTAGWRTADGRLVATAILGPRGRLDLQIDPTWPDLADELAGPFEQLARDRGWPAVYQFAPRTDPDFTDRLTARGYRLDYTAWILGLTDDAALIERTLPPGYVVRAFALTDAHATFELIENAFGEWDQRPNRSFATWESETLRRPGVDPSAFRVATYDGRVVGACIVYDSGREAWVSELATERTHRGRGVAQQLLAQTYLAARERGVPDGGLSTDSRTGALGLYQRLGMEIRHTIDSWRLDLKPTA